MLSYFLPRLINGPFDDPGLYIPFFQEKRAVIFDLGNIHSLSPKEILKISHAFVSHTHMDHFVGFDHLLRLFLGRDKELCLFGPPRFIQNIEGKLSGYSWNLVDNFEHQFALHVFEIHPNQILSRRYDCRGRFLPVDDIEKKPFSDVLIKEPAITVSATFLDHGIPSLGFSLKESYHININKEAVLSLGLDVGPWIKKFKQAVFDDVHPDYELEVEIGEEKRRFHLGELKKKIAIVTPGQKVTYITDVVFNEDNIKKITAFAQDSDHLFIESAFLEEDRDIAKKKGHLTARQAGYLAGIANVKRFTLFHFSPRYAGKEHLMKGEALEAFRDSIKL